MRALVFLSLVLSAVLAGCAQDANRVAAMNQPRLLVAPRAVYSFNELQAMQAALSQYIRDNVENLSKYRPVVVSGTVLPVGALEGQSFRPGAAMLRQLGYLAFDAPDVQIWIESPPADCIRGRCTLVGNVVTASQQFLVPVDY